MKFREFLKQVLKYENLYILEEKGNREIIVRVSRRHGKVTKARVLLFDSELNTLSKNEVYVNSSGYFIVRNQKRINMKLFV